MRPPKVIAKACVLFVIALIGFHEAALANTGSSRIKVSKQKFFERVSLARQSCLTHAYSVPRVTFDSPRGGWIDRYDPSTIQGILVFLYKPVVLELGGVIQGMLSGSGEEATVDYFLKRLGRDARSFVWERGLSEFESVCVASCIVNQLMRGDEVMHGTSFDMALANGVGDCKHFAGVEQALLRHMGKKVGFESSWTHAFNSVKIRGAKYYFDASVGPHECNFMPVE
jgi:hypothetical protein